MLKELSEVSLAQTNLLRTAIEFLQRLPAAASQGNVRQEAERIVTVKHFLRDYWAGQNKKARHLYMLLLNGRGSGTDGLNMRILEEQIAHLELKD
jgi:nitrate reductase beta subunit